MNKKRKKKSIWIKPTSDFNTLALERPSQGSSMVIQFFESAHDQRRWIGKSSGASLLMDPQHPSTLPLYLEEYLEVLGMKFYEALGVRTPQVVLSYQTVPEATQALFRDLGYSILPQTQCLHVMSQFLENFQEYGSDFVVRYRQQKAEGHTHFVVDHHGEQLILRGFGAAMAVANFVHDIDCVGNSGGNIGYVLTENAAGECYAETVKIDPGFSFAFIQDRHIFHHDPKQRDILIGTTISSLHYDDLMIEDQKEFLAKINDIISFPGDQIQSLIQKVRVPKGLTAEHEQYISKHLEARRQRFVAAFSFEIQSQLNEQRRKLRVQEAHGHDLFVQESYKDIREINALRAQVASCTFLEADLNLGHARAFQLPSSTSTFIGREDALQRIITFFNPLESYNIVNNQFCIVGMGGMGKSELAARYAHLREGEYQSILWFHAEAALERQLQLAAKSLFGVIGLVTVQDILARLMELTQGQKILWVFDNVEDFEGLTPFLCSQDHHVLITSRIIPPHHAYLQLAPFTVNEGVQYVQSELNLQGQTSDKNILRLLELLDFYPLAIVHAVNYIKRGYSTLEDYPALYYFHQLNPQTLFIEGEYDSVSTSILLSLRKVTQQEPLALKFLQCATCFPPEGIQINSLTILMKKPAEEVRKIADTLAQHSLIKLESDSILHLHRIVGRLILLLWTDEKARENTIQYVLTALPSSISDAKSQWLSVVGDLWEPLTDIIHKIPTRKNRLLILKFISNKDYHELLLFLAQMQDARKVSLCELRNAINSSFNSKQQARSQEMDEFSRWMKDPEARAWLSNQRPDIELNKIDVLDETVFDPLALSLMNILLENKENIRLDLNYCLSDKKTALHYAADNNNELLYGLLIKHGASDSRNDIHGNSPHEILMKHKNSKERSPQRNREREQYLHQVRLQKNQEENSFAKVKKSFSQLSEKEKMELILEEITQLSWIVNVPKKVAWYAGSHDQLELIKKIETHFKQVITETKRSTVKGTKQPIIILNECSYEELERVYVFPRQEERYLINMGDLKYSNFSLKVIIDRFYRHSLEEYLLLFDQEQPPNALELAVILNDFQIVKKMIEGEPHLLQIHSLHSWNALTYALAFRSDPEIIKLLIEKEPRLSKTVSLPKNKLYDSIVHGALYWSFLKDTSGNQADVVEDESDEISCESDFLLYHGLNQETPHPMIYFALIKGQTVKLLSREWNETSYCQVISLLAQSNQSALKPLKNFLSSIDFIDISNYDDDLTTEYSPLTVSISCRLPYSVIQLLADHTPEDFFRLQSGKTLFLEALCATNTRLMEKMSRKLYLKQHADFYSKQYIDFSPEIEEKIVSYLFYKFEKCCTQKETLTIFKFAIFKKYSENFLLNFIPCIKDEVKKKGDVYNELLNLALLKGVPRMVFKALFNLDPAIIFKSGTIESGLTARGFWRPGKSILSSSPNPSLKGPNF